MGFVDSSLFKAAVAVAPVTDLPTLTEQYRRTTGPDVSRH
jgi:hypothetical protein